MRARYANQVYSVEWIGDMMTPPLNVYTVSGTGVESGFYRVEVQH